GPETACAQNDWYNPVSAGSRGHQGPNSRAASIRAKRAAESASRTEFSSLTAFNELASQVKKKKTCVPSLLIKYLTRHLGRFDNALASSHALCDSRTSAAVRYFRPKGPH